VKEAKQQKQEVKERKKQRQQDAEHLVKGKITLTEKERESILLDLGKQPNSSFDSELYVAYAESLDYVVEVYRQMHENMVAKDYSANLYQFNTIIDQIKSLETILIGDGLSEGTWRKIIGDICEYQCKNTGNKGCRV
jgi:hypothetical protein